MPGIFKGFISLFKYKPPVEKFELLEGIGGAKEDQESNANNDGNNTANYHAENNTDNQNGNQASPGSNAQGNKTGNGNIPGSKAQSETNNSNTQDNKAQDSQTQNVENGNRKKKGMKTSLPVDEWNENKKAKTNAENQNQKAANGQKVFKEIELNMTRIKQEFNMPTNIDIVIREFEIAGKVKAFLLMVDGMVDKGTVNGFILRQLMTPAYFEEFNRENEDANLVEYILTKVLAINEINKETEFSRIISHVLTGSTALFIDNNEVCLLIDTWGYEKRSIEQPTTENVVRGPQEAFTENLRTNVTLIRRIIKNKKLITEILPVSKTSNSECAVMYMQGIANPAIIGEVKKRINSLDSDYISGAGMLEEAIADQPFMIIPQVLTTERPDRASAMLMDGKVIIITEGTPFASAVPTMFWESLHSPEDFFLKWQMATAIRYVRLLAILISLLVPGLYVALTTYHQEMIPTDLLTAIARSRENVPFPTIIEIILMDLSFELIREASLRMPGVMGGTLGIIGALILGQAAVSAQIVSPVLIIIVAVGAIGNFAIPTYTMAYSIRLLRFAVTIMSGLAGFYGIAVILVIICGFLCHIKSFGVPYLSPIAPKTKANPDIIASLPTFMQKNRPDALNTLDKQRQAKTMRGWSDKNGGKQS